MWATTAAVMEKVATVTRRTRCWARVEPSLHPCDATAARSAATPKTAVGLGGSTVASLTLNYRTPVEVMAEAEPVIRAALPDANVPTSVRRTGVPVGHGTASDLRRLVDDWLAAHAEVGAYNQEI